MKYGFEFLSGHSTTTGTPNKKTGRMSIAGNNFCCKTQTKINAWRNKHPTSRIECTKSQLRSLNAGISTVDFQNDLECCFLDE